MRYDHLEMLPNNAFRKRIGGGLMTLEGGKNSPAPPPAPNYTASAEATAKSQNEAINQTNYANRPNQKTPWGNTTWTTNATIDPATGQRVTQWNQNTSLTPLSQQALNNTLNIQQNQTNLANTMQPAVSASMRHPFNFNSAHAWGKVSNGAGASQNFKTNYLDNSSRIQTGGISGAGMYQPVTDSIYEGGMNRLMPIYGQQQSDLNAQLANRGIPLGSEASNRALFNLGRAQDYGINDLYNQSIQGGLGASAQLQNLQINQGNFGNSALLNAQNMNANALNNSNQALGFKNQAQNQNYNQSMGMANFNNALRQAQIAEGLQHQLTPLNMMNAVLSGNQVAMPQMPTFNPSQNNMGVNYSGATQQSGQYATDVYNAQTAQQSAMTNGLMSMGGMALGGYAGSNAGGKALTSLFGLG